MDADEVQSYLQDNDNASQQGEEEAAEGNAEASGSPQDDAPAADRVIALAEKYFDRVDAAQMLELLPEHTPVASLLRYFQIVLEYGTAQKRNLQVHCEHTAFTVGRLVFTRWSTFACFRSFTSCCGYGRCKFAPTIERVPRCGSAGLHNTLRLLKSWHCTLTACFRRRQFPFGD
jgi:hypothetical protein